MSAAALRSLVRTSLTDGDLLAAVAAGDTVAFAEVVRRFGPLVLGACRRVLGATPDTDDAFQLTLLALFKQAKSVRSAEALPGWLHRTAVRTAGKIRARTKQPTETPEAATHPDPAGELSWREARAALDEELNRLPDPLRGPLVLCYLDGRSRDDAAKALGVSLSTLKRRLAEGLDKLNRRLTRRGIVGVGLMAAVLGERGLTAAVPAVLANRVAIAANAIPFGVGLPPLFTTWKMTLSAVLLAGGLATGALLFARPADPPKAQPPKEQKADGKPATDQLDDPLPDGALARLGTARLRGRRLTFSPDGKRVVRETAGGDLQLFEVPSGKLLAKLKAKDVPERESIVGYTAAFTQDSKLLAAVLWEGRAGIWDTDTGKLVRWIDADKFYSIVRCDFSPDGKLLAFGSSTDNRNDESISVGVYEVATGKKLFAESGSSYTFSDDGKQLFAWNGYNNRKNLLRVVPIATPDDATLAGLPTNVPNGEDPRTDGKELLFELTATGDVRLIDWKSGDVKHTLTGPVRDKEKGGVNLRHARGRRELIVTQADPPKLWCFDLDKGELKWDREVPAPPYWAELSADGKTVVTPGKDGDVLTIDALTGKDKAVIPAKSVGHSNHTPHISPEGKVVATESAAGGSGGGSVLFWDAATGKLLSVLPGHSGPIHDAVFTPDGSKVLTAGRDDTVRTWDAATGKELSKVTLPAPTWLRVSPDGKTLFAADAKTGKVRVVDPTTGKVTATFDVFNKELVGISLTADGKKLIAAGRGAAGDAGWVRVLDAATGKAIREFDTGTHRVEQVAASADGSVIVTSGEGRKVAVWAADGSELSVLTGEGLRKPSYDTRPPFHLIGSVAVTSDGTRVLFSDQEAGVGVIDGKSGEVLGRAKTDATFWLNGGARYEISDRLAVSPDGKTAAWSGVESTSDIYLIELRSLTVRRKFDGDSYPVQRLAFSPDGSKLLSAGPDGSALVWDVFDRTAKPPADAKPSDWWGALADADAGKADLAMRAMAVAAAEAVKLLADKLPGEKVTSLRTDRAVEVLERIGSDDAKKLLEEVGENNPDAKRAAERLNRFKR